MDRQKLFDYSLKAYLFLSPLFFFNSFKVSYARGLFFILASFALFGISLTSYQKRRFSSVWTGLLLLLSLVRVFFDKSVCNPQAEWFNFWINCASFIYILSAVLLFFIVYCYADNIKSYIKPIVFVCIANLILVIAQLTGNDFMWHNAPSICGFFESSSQLGQYSAMAIPLLFYINPALSLIPLSTLIISQSVSPMLACSLGVLVFGGFKGRILKLKALLVIILIIFTSLNFGYIKSKFQCRPNLWGKTLKISLQKPYLGSGYRSFKEKVNEIKDETYSLGNIENLRAHNDYLHTAQELGFPVMICFIMFLFSLYKQFRNAVKDKFMLCLLCSVFIGLVIMTGQTMIRYSSIAGTFIVLLALLSAEIKDKKII